MKHLMTNAIFYGLVAATLMCCAAVLSVRFAPQPASRLNVPKPALAKPAEAVQELGGEFTQEYARLNGIDCPVYLRLNGTYFAVAGAERLDVDRVAGHARRDGVVRAYYRTRRDGVAANNLSLQRE